MKNIKNLEDYDFGFSLDTDVVSAKDYATTQDKIQELESRLEAVYRSIIPLLDNLCKNPDQANIHWPDRVEKIETFKAKLKSLKEGK